MRRSGGATRWILQASMVALLACAGEGRSHPGGLDGEGCHHDRKRGGYHCHRAPAPMPASRAMEPGNLDEPRPRQAPGDGRAYRNCDEARAAGAAPVRRGEPGYGPHLDRDNDGVGCEPYRGR